MTVFDQLSERQQVALQGAVAGVGTRKALMGLGLAERDDLSGFKRVVLTDLGRIVLFAHEQRENTTALFKQGDRVVSLDFGWPYHQLRFEGRDLVVMKVGKEKLTLQRNSYQVQRFAFNVAHYADVEAAGLLGLVRPDPLEVQSDPALRPDKGHPTMTSTPGLFPADEPAPPREWRSGDEAIWKWLYVTLIEQLDNGDWRIASPSLSDGRRVVAEAELQPRPPRQKKRPAASDDLQPLPAADEVQAMPDLETEVRQEAASESASPPAQAGGPVTPGRFSIMAVDALNEVFVPTTAQQEAVDVVKHAVEPARYADGQLAQIGDTVLVVNRKHPLAAQTCVVGDLYPWADGRLLLDYTVDGRKGSRRANPAEVELVRRAEEPEAEAEPEPTVEESVFMKLSGSQQQALQGAVADSGVRRALHRRGLISDASEAGSGFKTVELTGKGRLVLLEHAQRKNTADMFRPGDTVLYITHYFQAGQPVIHGEWSEVIGQDDAGLVELRAEWANTHVLPCRIAHAAEAEQAGVAMADKLPVALGVDAAPEAVEAEVTVDGFNYGALDMESRMEVRLRRDEIRTLLRRTAQDIVDIGGKLADVKARLDHGQFGAWLEQEFQWKERMARNFMAVHERFKTANFADLAIAPSALYLLASPSVPEETAQAVIERAQAGEHITYTAAKDAIDASKPAITLGAGMESTGRALIEMGYERDGNGRYTKPKAEPERVIDPETGEIAAVEADELAETVGAAPRYRDGSEANVGDHVLIPHGLPGYGRAASFAEIVYLDHQSGLADIAWTWDGIGHHFRTKMRRLKRIEANPVEEIGAEKAQTGAAEWGAARVLVSGEGVVLGIVRKTSSQQYDAWDLVVIKHMTFATHQEAVEWIERRMGS